MTSPSFPSPEAVRDAIAGNCLVGSWFAMRPCLVQMESLAEAGPVLLADLLATAGARVRVEADRLQRLLSHRQWHARAGAALGGRRHITVTSGKVRWSMCLLLRPQLHIETIAVDAAVLE